MDYTNIPRPLIYRERNSLEEFIESNELNGVLIKNMTNIDVPFVDFEYHALRCMNEAYYICTIIMLEKYPEWRLSQFDNNLNSLCLDPIEENKKIIFSLVYLMLLHYNEEWKKNNRDLYNKIYVRIYPEEKYETLHLRVYREGGPKDILGTLETKLPSVILPDDEFAPCAIDVDVASEVIRMSFNWRGLTNNYDEKKIREIENALGKNSEEELLIYKILINAVKKDRRLSESAADEKVRMLYNMKDNLEEYCLTLDKENNPFSLNVKENTPLAETPSLGEIASLKQRVQDLETENLKLRKQLNQYQSDNDQESILTLKAKLTASEDFVNDLKQENAELKAFKQEMEDLMDQPQEDQFGIDERAIFFSISVGLDFDPNRTNQMQLANLISKLSGDKIQSIRGRISKMHRMEKNKNYSDEVLQAARNVKGLLEKISQGNLPPKLKDIIENIDVVYLNANNS
ncbi:MAG: hypothetical protein K6A96_01910 [Prevotella sp.]|nr:hypothetical protein [Prevotella sp.]